VELMDSINYGRGNIMKLLATFFALALLSANSAFAQAYSSDLQVPSRADRTALMERMKAEAVPAARFHDPAVSFDNSYAPASTELPSVVAGSDTAGQAGVMSAGGQLSGIEPNDYGSGSGASVFHYTDQLVNTWLGRDANYMRAGKFYFTASDGNTYYCTAALISKSILATAGHCVHDGGNGDAGWITSGYFVPFEFDGTNPYREAWAIHVVTTGNWYGTGNLAQAYDVGLVVLTNPTSTVVEYGDILGWYGFCIAYCKQAYWYLTQLGYPGNYYGGANMTEGQHLEVDDPSQSLGYVYGSGMEGGSSGGPHLANHGEIVDSSAGASQWSPRNIVFAVTSWGYVDPTLKIQGSSPLTGTGEDDNDFAGMFNLACSAAQGAHGPGSCGFL
jgi:V8-like Glu-specific endopeptidase